MKERVTFEIDACETTGDLEHSWKFIGYDECNYTYMPEGMDLLKKFASLGDAPYFFRTHFMFCTGNGHPTMKFGSTNLYSEDAEGNPVYNYEYFDKVIDAYLATNSKPFIEFGFMPMDLADAHYLTSQNNAKLQDYKISGWACPPKDYDKWHELIKNVICHLRDTYGEEEISTWYYELWNEPDIFYWHGSNQEYFKLYDYTEKAVHEVLPQLRLGGPATAISMGFLDGFLKHCRSGVNYCTGAVGTRLDYVTFHVKGGGFSFNLTPPKQNPTVEMLLDAVKAGLDIMVKNGFGDRELILSEADPDGWAAGSMYDNPNLVFRNTEYYASYVAYTYDKLERLSESYKIPIRPLAWAFFFPGERCFEGTRTFTTQGINKAVFNLFRIYGQLGDKKLKCEMKDNKAVPGVGGYAVRGKNRETQIVIYSHNNDREFTGTREICIEIEGHCAARGLEVTHHRIDGEHSNAYAQWLKEGSPLYPQGGQYERIKLRDCLEAYSFPAAVSSASNKVSIAFAMPAHGVSLLVVSEKATAN